MTWGQGYQRLPPHMERISGHRPQQLLLPPPVSIFYSTHACILLKMQTQQPRSATTTQVVNHTFAHSPVTPPGSEPKTWTPFCTHFMSLEKFLFPAGGDIARGSYPNIAMLFQTSYLVSSKTGPLQQSAYLLIWNVLVFCLCITVSELSCVCHCETSIRTSVGKLDKDFDCIILCGQGHSCYMRDASSVAVSWPVHRGTIGAMTGKVWNQGNGMEVTRDYRINKKGCFPQNLGYDGFAVVSSRQTLVRQHCPTQDVGVGKWLSVKPCNKIYNRT